MRLAKQDIDLEAQDVRLHYIVDAFNIIDYCFPSEHFSFRQKSLDELANDQVAMTNFFYLDGPDGGGRKAVLLDEYIYEIELFSKRLHYNLVGTDRLMAEIEKAVREGNEDWRKGLEHIRGSTSGDDADLHELSRHFNIALGLGLYRHGVRRFKEILDERSVIVSMNEAGSGGQDSVVLADIVESSRARPYAIEVAEDCFDLLYPGRSRFSGYGLKRWQALLRDVAAIDRVSQFNKQVAERKSELEREHLFLYLSFASRTSPITTLLRERLGLDDASKTFIWRDVTSLFAMAAHRAQAGDLNEIEASLERMAEAQSRGMGTRRTADERKVIEWMNATVRFSSKQVPNLGLVSKVENYRGLLDRAEDSTPESERYILDYVRRAAEESDEASVRGDLAITLLDAESRFLSRWGHRLKLRKEDFKKSHNLRRGRDAVISTIQRLPLQTRFVLEPYSRLFRRLRGALITAPNSLREFRTEIISVVDEYFDSETEHSLERDLFLYQLFFLLPEEGEEGRIADYAKRTSDGLRELPRSEDDRQLVAPEIEYIRVWALRRARRYEDSFALAGEAIDRFRHDPRFRQGRFLAAYSWRVDREMKESLNAYNERARREGIPEVSLEQMSRDTAESLALAEAQLEKDEANDLYQETLASCLNNTLYHMATGVRQEAERAVTGGTEISDNVRSVMKTARGLLVKLKGLEDPQGWETRNPAHAHTEASVELVEALVLVSDNRLKAARRKLLEAGRRSTGALSGFDPPKPEGYPELDADIVAWLENVEQRSDTGREASETEESPG